MGTGQTLALLPPQNATGNFVKIVQRLPVRIELTNYNPDKDPLFVGTSVEPYVYFKEKLEGAHAGNVLQPLYSLPRGISASEAAEKLELKSANRVAEGPHAETEDSATPRSQSPQ
jgi:membrane fusion protein (multidrug efflux system)